MILTPSVNRFLRVIALASAIAAVHGPPASAQERQEVPPDSIRAELRRLNALVDSLRAEVERLRAAGKDEDEDAGDALAQLRAAAAAAAAAGAPGAQPAAAGEQDQQFVGRQRSLQALNPEISLTGDVFASLDPDATTTDNFVPREFEISIISNLDPFSRAKVFLSRHVEGAELMPFGGHGDGEGGEEEHADDAHGSGFSVEEGYVEWVSLPGGFGAKLGKFFQQFGQLNRWHSHALPFQSRSLPSLAFIGEESLAQTGASIRWLLPYGGAGTYEATLEVTRSENETLFGESGRPSTLLNLNGFWQLTPSTDLDLALSWANGSYQDEANFFDRNLFGAEMSFTWRPPEAARYRGFNLRAGTMVLDGLVPHDDPGTEPEVDQAERAFGFWTMGELRLSQSWLIGGRFDRVEDPHEPDETAWLAGPTLTWWQSEYVRIRAEYALLGQSALENQGRLYVQVTFSMGPHKHETY